MTMLMTQIPFSRLSAAGVLPQELDAGAKDYRGKPFAFSNSPVQSRTGPEERSSIKRHEKLVLIRCADV